MKLAPYPPYSPDLVPAGFFLFGYVKRCLAALLWYASVKIENAVGSSEHDLVCQTIGKINPSIESSGPTIRSRSSVRVTITLAKMEWCQR
jgi:hypothetical protein